MDVLKDLQNLKDAEDFFHYFGVEYDENILKPYRLHILKKFNLYMQEVLNKGTETDLFPLLKECLIRAYQDFLHSTPIQERLFKVHKDALSSRLVNLEVKGKNYGKQV
ncbi:nitrogenase-stabilizing/protective protein NifW [Hydrogenobacter sp. T-2]|uniref:nitrogenase-stabilizing/protective protein NifW n=1 Tax=Pampinifervens diazotrophicum TaxID=1632018 RepID=UPI002B263BD9|nr:nitrogenase-stabilizing/protective protein NifW [Hydrogenobacter sp. T-2]WPM31468.1 nitrogenase-stabilizing/protective protein NifW [Hydrogenobacter sp. T-2]